LFEAPLNTSAMRLLLNSVSYSLTIRCNQGNAVPHSCSHFRSGNLSGS
jgi:hypothetical protein